MSYRTLRQIFLLAAFVFTQAPGFAQDLTGIWRGYFITDGYEHYKFEIQISHKGNFVSGVSYSYLSTVFYGKATLTGNFNRSSKNAMIREIKTVELRMSGNSQACIMKCMFTYNRSGREEFLEGKFTSVFEKDGLLTRRGQNCGGGNVFLRRVTSSDFYIEPFLRGKIKEREVIFNEPPRKKETTEPKTVPEKKEADEKVTTDRKPEPPSETEVKKTVDEPPVTVKKDPRPAPPDVIRKRSNELVRVLTVRDPDVTVKLYDNGEIDDDTISVYLDNKLILASQRLTASPLELKFRIEDEKEEHELVMVAENLGRIPPNTSLMIVESGGQRFQVRITSTEQKNAVVRFRYRKE